jgi:hypothetical protein
MRLGFDSGRAQRGRNERYGPALAQPSGLA